MAETVYLLHDNSILLVLKEDGEPQILASVTRMVLKVGEVSFDSAVPASGAAFDWASGDTGEVDISLGLTTLEKGMYYSRLVVYGPVYTNGLVWGDFDLVVD